MKLQERRVTTMFLAHAYYVGLTHTAYDNTIVDLLGVSSDYGKSFAADNVVDGFFNNAEALTVTGLLADQYRDAAENIAAQAITFI